MPIDLFQGGGGYDYSHPVIVDTNISPSAVPAGVAAKRLGYDGVVIGGAEPANAWITVLDVSGAGFLRGYYSFMSHAGNQKISLRIVLDGVETIGESVESVGSGLMKTVGQPHASMAASETIYLPVFNYRFDESLVIQARRLNALIGHNVYWCYSLDRE